MESIEDVDPGVVACSSIHPEGVVLFRDTDTSKSMSTSSPLHTSNSTSNMDITTISTSTSPCHSPGPSMNLSPDRAPPLPSTGGFRLQPRKNSLNLAIPSPSIGSSSSSRRRKRGAQTMTPTFGSSNSTVPKYPFSPGAFVAINTSNSNSSNGFAALPPRHNESSVASPISVNHALQSMSIKSPPPPTHSSQQNSMRDRDSSPFILFSPSLKLCPYRQRSRCENFCSVDSSTKVPSSVVTTPRIAPLQVIQSEEQGMETATKATTGSKHNSSIRNGDDTKYETVTLSTARTPSTPSTYGSPRKQAYGGNNNNDILLSTPRSHSQAANASQTPATPASVRTLPSPYATPLPRSMRLTPRSRHGRGELSSYTSIFLSPNERVDAASPAKEGTVTFSFEVGMESLQQRRQRAVSISSSYIPSPDRKESGGGSLRVETRSLLGPQDSTSVLDFMVMANARAAALDCDGSLSDDSDLPFVLANPVTLAQQRDIMTMSPPRPSQRRRMSPAPVFASIVASTHDDGTVATIQNNIGVDGGDDDTTRDANLMSRTATHCQMNVPISRHNRVGKKLSPKLTLDTNCGLPCPQPSIEMISARSRYDHKYSGQLKPIDSFHPLVGLSFAESSSMMDDNARPQTPPPMLDTSVSSLPPTPSSNSSVRISRSDADNVHLTIASMAAIHQQSSPTLTTCKS